MTSSAYIEPLLDLGPLPSAHVLCLRPRVTHDRFDIGFPDYENNKFKVCGTT